MGEKKTKGIWQYPAETITDTNYANDLMLLANISAQAESLIHNLEQATRGIGLYVKSDKTEIICFNQNDAMSSL